MAELTDQDRQTVRRTSNAITAAGQWWLKRASFGGGLWKPKVANAGETGSEGQSYRSSRSECDSCDFHTYAWRRVTLGRFLFLIHAFNSEYQHLPCMLHARQAHTHSELLTRSSKVGARIDCACGHSRCVRDMPACVRCVMHVALQCPGHQKRTATPAAARSACLAAPPPKHPLHHQAHPSNPPTSPTKQTTDGRSNGQSQPTTSVSQLLTWQSASMSV